MTPIVSGMRFLALVVVLLVVATLVIFGAALALPAYNIPGQYRLHVATKSPEEYVVCVAAMTSTNDFPVSPDGAVTLDVPRLPRSCSWMFFGFSITDGSPKSLKAIHIMRDGRVIRRLSLRQIEALPLDSRGARQIRL